MAAQPREWVVVIVGCGGVGKTACIARFTNGHFAAEYDPTVYYCVQHSVLINEKLVRMVFDEDGAQEDTINIERRYRRADAIIFVYSVSSDFSFQEMDNMRARVDRVRANLGLCPFVIAANKVDLIEREVGIEAANALADRWRCPYFEVSAKENTNIQELFQFIAETITQTAAFENQNQPRPKTDSKCFIQ